MIIVLRILATHSLAAGMSNPPMWRHRFDCRRNIRRTKVFVGNLVADAGAAKVGARRRWSPPRCVRSRGSIRKRTPTARRYFYFVLFGRLLRQRAIDSRAIV